MLAPVNRKISGGDAEQEHGLCGSLAAHLLPRADADVECGSDPARR